MRNEPKGMELSKTIFIGRTFEEYMSMFSLEEEDIQGKSILDAPAGACSFNAVASSKGADVISCDIAYSHSIEELQSKGMHDIQHAVAGITQAKDQFTWGSIKDIQQLKQFRLTALNQCVGNMKKNPEKYIFTELPFLPFEDQHFDLTLSAHFLFTYGDRLDEEFHLNTIKELLRVTKTELRIFPLVDLQSKRYSALDSIIEYIQSLNWKVEEKKAKYEFQREANSYLKIQRNL